MKKLKKVREILLTVKSFFMFIINIFDTYDKNVSCLVVWRGLQRENKDFFETYGHFVSPRPFLSKILWEQINFISANIYIDQKSRHYVV